MSNNKKSFLLHIDSLGVLDDLTNEQAGMLFKAIKAHQTDGEFELNSIVKIAFSPFKNQFVRDDEKYQKTCERRAIAGSMGGKQKVANASKCKQELANVADNKTKNKNKTNNDNDSKDLLCEEAFTIFYSAGLVKKSKVKALSTFRSLVKQMDCDPMEFAELLKSDVQYRINNNQFGIDKLHPSTYLNQQRWTDEHEESNNGYAQGGRKLSAAERIRERNEREYGSQQPGSGMGMATDGGDIRGAVGEGTRGDSFIDMESSSQQSDPGAS